MKANKKLGMIIIVALALLVTIVMLVANVFTKSKIVNESIDVETLKAISYGQLTESDTKVQNCEYVQFSAFFLKDINNDNYAEKIKGTCKQIGATDTLYIDINVLTEGSLKNGKITINGENFAWTTATLEDLNVVKGNYIGKTSEIILQDEVKNGNQKLIWGIVDSKIQNNINNYSKVNSIILTGTYVDDEGNETPITKTSNITVDWYGETKTEVNKYYYSTQSYTSYQNQMYDIATAVTEESLDLTFQVAIAEIDRNLILQKQEVEIEIPEVNGFKPTEVISTDKDVTYTYNEETGKIKITKESTIDEHGEVKQIARSNLYNVKAIYPLETYTTMDANSVALSIPIVGYNYGYNNKDKNFTNPYMSSKKGIVTITYSNPSGDTWNIETYVGNKINTYGNYRYVVSKQPATDIYNGNEYEGVTDQYTVEWNVLTENYEGLKGFTLEEKEKENSKTDEFLNNSNKKISMHNYITTTGVYFVNASTMLGKNGWIKLYDAETGILLETFTSEIWKKYSKVKPYEVNVKSIKIETSAPVAGTYFSVIQIKEINDEQITQEVTKEEFEEIAYIYTYLKGTAETVEGVTFENGATTEQISKNNYAYYEMPETVQELSINPAKISNQETQNVNMHIYATSNNFAEAKWKDGVFLIELPKSILSVNVKEITTSNNNVQIQSYNTYEQDGKKYIKIYTQNEVEETYTITVNVDMIANSLNPTTTELVELYAYNPAGDNYRYEIKDKYDIDNDGIADDTVGYSSRELSLIAPSGLLTTEYVTNYNDLGNITVAPNIAEIEKSNNAKTATININVVNNYSGTISETKIIGRTPFEGNTYVINVENLNSQFTATMLGPIKVPVEMQDKVIVYYTQNGSANEDLQDFTNAWKTEDEITDWTKVKSYLIDFGEYILQKDEERLFTYEVEVPGNINYNSATFGAHAVYYCLDTEYGKLEIATEPNKVGIQVVAKYNLELVKNKAGNNNILVPGASYKVVTTDIDGNEIVKIETTDANGKIKFSNLYIEKEYILKEISSPAEYSLSNEEIKFKAKVNSENELQFEVISGNFGETPEITIGEDGFYLVKTKVEDQAKYKLVINKKDELGAPLSDVRFTINGKDKVNKTYKTNKNGTLTIDGLHINEEYRIQETVAEGYYVDTVERIFKISRNSNGKLELQTQDEVLSNITITEQQNEVQALAEIDVSNEKIPTYNLQILKVEQNDEETEIENLKPLQGATFLLTSEDTDKRVEYITDENGNVIIEGLYQYIDGKYITGQYSLQEIKAPAGYTNNAELINFKVSKQGEKLSVEIENREDLVTVNQVKVEGNIIKLIIQDKPLFRLTKIDSETGEVLSNAKFVIYEINENGGEIDYAKDVNGNYVGELNADGQYVVTTNENGVITLPLRDGLYRSVEIGFPEGYQENSNEEIFRVGEARTENVEVREISYIEDLVDLSKSVNNGNKYEGKKIVLTRTLDFKEESSYRNPSNLSYGDLNGNGEIETIISELTNENGCGFTPIGYNYNNQFRGIFDGQGNEIRNIYIYTNRDYVGLFGYASYAEIMNLGITGNVTGYYSNIYSGYVAGIVAYANMCKINNCYNIANITRRKQYWRYNRKCGEKYYRKL